MARCSFLVHHQLSLGHFVTPGPVTIIVPFAAVPVVLTTASSGLLDFLAKVERGLALAAAAQATSTWRTLLSLDLARRHQ
jgi:hypothetical protein